MGKTRQKPRINTSYKKLIEISDHGQSAVVCVACWRKRRDAYDKTFNRSSYTGAYGRHTYQLRDLADIAPHEKVVCVDCGAKNNNGNNGVSWWNIWR